MENLQKKGMLINWEFWTKNNIIKFISQFVFVIAGSYGQWVVQKTRPDILRKFHDVVEHHSTSDDNLMAQYIHQCNAQSPT